MRIFGVIRQPVKCPWCDTYETRWFRAIGLTSHHCWACRHPYLVVGWVGGVRTSKVIAETGEASVGRCGMVARRRWWQ